MIYRDRIERNIDYIKNNDGIFHELYVAIIVYDVMNIPLELVDDEKLNRISEIIDFDKMYDENFKKKILDIEKEVEQEKIFKRHNGSEINL